MEKQFNIGDRVIFIADSDPDNGVFKGQTGTVCYIRSRIRVGVNWDDWHADYHDCEGTCPENHGWNVPRDMVDILFEDYELDLSEDGADFLLRGIV